MVSLETETDRTLFFDLLPIDVGSIGGFNTRIQLYTVPGQVFYNTTRKLVLKGVDGVVFVADSQRPMLKANATRFATWRRTSRRWGSPRDHPAGAAVQQARPRRHPAGRGAREGAQPRGPGPTTRPRRSTGEGVFETLRGISKLTLVSLKRRLTKGAQAGPAARPAAAKASAAAKAPEAASAAPEASSPAPAAERPQAETARGVAAKAEPAKAKTAATPAAAAKPGRKSSTDVMAELEKIRRQAMRQATPEPAAPAPAASANGAEIHRSVQVSLDPAAFARAQRFLVQLQVEDADRQVVEALEELRVDLPAGKGHDKVVLQLSISLKPR
jgi:hypothetical protein